MLTHSHPRWVVRNVEGLILTTKGLWVRYPNDKGGAKFYSTSNRAITYGLKGKDGTAYLVPAYGRITLFGNIIHASGLVERFRG